jgi:GNAT superfamily N-acetyltransferase
MADLGMLSALRDPEALHRDRLRDAKEPTFQYLALEYRTQIVGFTCLVFQRPLSWPDTANNDQLPQIVDLFIDPTQRGQGYGTIFLQELEQRVRRYNHDRLYLSVDPVGNLRAHALYLRLGYQPLHETPYRDHWEWIDSDGHRHIGDEWAVDMVKIL